MVLRIGFKASSSRLQDLQRGPLFLGIKIYKIKRKVQYHETTKWDNRLCIPSSQHWK